MEISSDPHYDSARSKSTTLVRPVLRYLHWLIAYAICGRQQSTRVVSKSNLLQLYCMVHGVRSNIEGCLTYYFSSMSNKKIGALYEGNYVTKLARNLGVFAESPVNIPMEPLGMSVMINIGMVRKDRQYFILVGPSQGQDLGLDIPDQ